MPELGQSELQRAQAALVESETAFQSARARYDQARLLLVLAGAIGLGFWVYDRIAARRER